MTRYSLILLSILAACMPTGPSTLESLASNRSLWEERRPEKYEFTLRRSPCECPIDWLVPTRVTVHERQIQSARNAETGMDVSIDPQHVLTVDDLFELVEQAFEESAFRVNVTYDLEFGYPTSVFIDYRPNQVDDEVGFTAYEFQTVE